MDRDERRETFRWTTLSKKAKKIHLWIGQSTGCGLRDVKTLGMGHGEFNCHACEAYLSGWLDRHDYGTRFVMGQPNPCGASTVLERKTGRHAA